MEPFRAHCGVRFKALIPLRNSQPAIWQPFDLAKGLNERGVYELAEHYKKAEPRSAVVLEGAYSCHPRLRDLIDFKILIDVDVETRHSRLKRRENDEAFLSRWHSVWDEVEHYYFTYVSPPNSFDLVIKNEDICEQNRAGNVG